MIRRALFITAVIFNDRRVAHDGLIINSDFSSPTLPADSYSVYTQSSSQSLPGWTVVSGSIDIQGHFVH